MSKTISKGRILRVTVEVDDERLRQMKKAPELAMQAMQAGADYWHERILPKHFDKSAHGRYGYAQRSISYLKRQKGKPDLVFKGSLRDDTKAKASFRQASGYVELKMSARVLNFVPNMAESNVDLYVKQKNGRGYPNLKREIKAITDDEREMVANVVAKELERLFGPT